VECHPARAWHPDLVSEGAGCHHLGRPATASTGRVGGGSAAPAEHPWCDESRHGGGGENPHTDWQRGVKAVMGGPPRGAEPKPSAWQAQLMLAGQNLVGNQAIANPAVTSPAHH
jgi:hypothetical protein